MFKLRAFVALALAASTLVASSPISPPPAVDDTSILNFALTLEFLENAFYQGGLAKYDEGAFANAGFQPWVRARYEQIAAHEATHIAFLQSALGDSATQACTYNFPDTDPQSFVDVSMALESVGAAAYLGAASFIADKGTLTAAGSILAVENRQASWISSAVLHEQPWDGPFETPLGFSAAFSLASGFIVSCPDTNPGLPVQTFPALTLSNGAPHWRDQITVYYDNENFDCEPFLAYFDGLNVVYSAIDENGVTTIPDGLHGVVFAVVVDDENQVPDESTMLSGFAILNFPFTSFDADPSA